MKLVELPRGHLSWSGLDMYERSPRAYIEKYILHQPQRTSREMVFGKYLADELEKDKPDDATIAELKGRLPTYDKREQDIWVVYKGIPLMGRIDSYRASDSAFTEDKSGHRDTLGNPPWTPAKAKAHGQIAFYAFMLWLKTKKVPPTALLNWIETAVLADGTIGLAEHIHTFEVPITMPMLLDIGGRIERAAREINKTYLTYCRYVKNSKGHQEACRQGTPGSARSATRVSASRVRAA